MLSFRTLRSNQFVRNYSVQNSWNATHVLFKHKEVSKNVYFIQEKYFEFSWNLANIFFIKGSECDLLIDTGVGIHSLPRYLSWAGLRPASSDLGAPEKPLQVVLTHCHFDHSGGAHQFPRVWAHTAEAEVIRQGDKFMTASWISGQEVTPKPRDWRARDYCVQPSARVTCLGEGHVFRLGDRDLEVLHIPGHSPGSIAVHDKDNGILVTGDTLYQTDHGLIDWYPGSSSGRMGASVSRLLDLIRATGVEVVCPGHNDVITGLTALEAGERYLEENTLTRRAKKTLSRARAGAILRANKYFVMPELCKELVAN